ncbi:MAG TPA: hypothetical protein VNJ01_05445 [Bacteriovoracaceae bacterium]|nr:hypothetical protein [Bacteriovoracaceae bacterium]
MDSPKDDFLITEEVAEWLGLKKSEYLSKLIQLMAQDDFGFEEFSQYDHLLAGTIETPDRSYGFEEDGYELRTYIKTYNLGQRFHQILLGVLLPDKAKNAQVLVPVLNFISRKDELVLAFSTGEVISRQTLN